ncbi:MAG: trypsin-like peptidase domain-containing protein [Planctomycetes bacterium]|nr:trypsin-like peptidase domain-containing protein [Planctomycetota bacterium]MBL7044541.1 trypsin-like peptidase domain-containing protein [Pirellulaceae bacterium]
MSSVHGFLSMGGESFSSADTRRGAARGDSRGWKSKLRRAVPQSAAIFAAVLSVTSLTAVVWAAEPSAPSSDAAQSNDTRLRYRGKKDEPHAYRFRIEMAVGDDRVVTTDGSITYTARPASEVLPEEESEGTGTAFVVSSDGYLVSCAHVVEGATRIEVTLADKKYPARVVDWNKQRDLALLRIEASGLPELRLGATKDVELAQEVRAVGYPLTDVLGQSVKITRGTIAGWDRLHWKHGCRLRCMWRFSVGQMRRSALRESSFFVSKFSTSSGSTRTP